MAPHDMHVASPRAASISMSADAQCGHRITDLLPLLLRLLLLLLPLLLLMVAVCLVGWGKEQGRRGI